jgi:hypothetical protein
MANLPDDIAARVAREFSGNASDDVLPLRSEFLAAQQFREVRCILHLAGGDIAKIQYYADLARQDSRDMIYWAEYDRDDHQVRDFRQPFIE